MVSPTPSPAVEDTLTVGSVPLALPGTTVEVPVSVRDASGTLLGGDVGGGRSIQALAVVVQVSPPSAVTSVTFQKAGATAGSTPLFEQAVSVGDERGTILTFSESGAPLHFNIDAPAPGDLVGKFVVAIDPQFDQGIIDLELVESKTALGNQTGSLVQKPDERLTLNDGSIYVDSNALFFDGFESGNVSAWSRSVP